MSSKYSLYSPYAKVKQTWYLGYNLPNGIDKASTDIHYTIPNKYDEQPWRLAAELYGNERLYYIFALLNPNELADPIYDFTAGKTISIPSVQRMQSYLSSTRNVR
jgi:hypothetical protein